MLILLLGKGDFILDFWGVPTMKKALEEARELLLPCKVIRIEELFSKDRNGIRLSNRARFLLFRERLASFFKRE